MFRFATRTIVFRFTTGTIVFRLIALPICAYFLLPGMSLLCSILLPLLVCSILLPLLLCSILPLLILCPTPGLQALHTRSVFSHSARDQHERRHGRGLHIKNTPDTSPDLFFFSILVLLKKQGATIQPVKGLTLIWPADWTFTHRGVPSPTQVGALRFRV